MLRTKVDHQPSLWETLLPPEVNALPAGLEAIDRLLDDPVFFDPFVPHFDPEIGRPSIPLETYLRMMFLRFRYRLGFDALCREVTDSLSWRRFCRIGITDSVPHPTTLLKITARCGEEAVAALNQALLQKAVADKLIKIDKLRADTTVVAANVAYPTDSSLLAKGVAKIAKTVAAIKALGLAPRTRFRNRTRSVRRRAHDIGAWLRGRSGDAKDEVLALTQELARTAECSIADAQAVAANARRQLRAGRHLSGRAKALVCDLERTISVLDRLVVQARSRIDGDMPAGATRVVSLHDTDARPIRKGRLDRPVEFGYKAQVVDNAQGVVVDHQVTVGNPADAPMLVPAIKRVVALVGRTPRAVTADRGYGEAAVESELRDIGVKTVAIPRKGRPKRRVKRSSALARSAGSSSGGPAPRAGSRTSSTPGDSSARCSTASPAHRSGADGECSPTTPSRSLGSWTSATSAVPPVRDERRTNRLHGLPLHIRRPMGVLRCSPRPSVSLRVFAGRKRQAGRTEGPEGGESSEARPCSRCSGTVDACGSIDFFRSK